MIGSHETARTHIAVLLSTALHAATLATIATVPQDVWHVALPNAGTTTSGSRAMAPVAPVQDHPAPVVSAPATALPGSAQFQPAGWSTSRGIAAHIWRATAFAVGVGLLTLAFRRNGAHVRYGLWLSASVVFLLPVRAPFLPVPSFPDAPVSAGTLLLAWTFGFAAIAAIRFRKWRSLRRIARSSCPAALPLPIPDHVAVRSVPGLMEPGVCGLWRPVLLIPADIERYLTARQLSAVVAHELCHVRRHDNLTALVHMVVEMIFWWHPLVWFIGSRLVHERERACDEHVLRTLHRPRLYARALLNVCRRYVQAPRSYVSAAGGPNIVRRVEAILRNEEIEAVGPVKKAILAAAIVLVVLPIVSAPFSVARLQAQNAPPDRVIDASTRTAVIDSALAALNESYVYPDVAKEMEEAIRARQQRGEYEAVTSASRFAELLTEHLRDVSRDLHLQVNLIPSGPPPGPPPPAPSGAGGTMEERRRAVAARRNFGFARVERLEGNIGYIDLRGFMAPEIASETAAAAMTFLGGTDGIIFDVRQNNGGSPEMVAFLTSYLFEGTVHLNDFYSRPTNETRQSWTLAYVPGRRFPGKNVYILTSRKTFSGAEEFTYNLRHLDRATVVGETTAGAAHLVGGRRISDGFAISVPTGRPINPVTKTSWEGVGVEPHVKVPADNALSVAHTIALEQQQWTIPADAAGLRNEVSNALSRLRGELSSAGLSIPSSSSENAVAASLANDDFESGALTKWRIDRKGPGGWFVYTNGRTPPSLASTDPGFPFAVPEPPQGRFAALTDMNGPGRFILSRKVTLDGRYRLRMTVFYANSGRFSATTSTQNAINDEQQYRVDLVAAGAPVDTTADAAVVATILMTKPADSSRLDPTEMTIDLSKWEGQTVRLRFAVGQNQAPLRAGVDAIRFEKLP
jgi:Zn-dependent protease with chaperone function